MSTHDSPPVPTPSPTPSPTPTRSRRQRGFWAERPSQPRPAIPWLWQGYLAPGLVTMLTAQWKSGKTTLLTALLARLKTGGDFAGLSVTPARAVVVSEESEEQWAPRLEKFDLGHVYLICRPFAGVPTLPDWHDLLEDVAAEAKGGGATFVAFDTLPTFLPVAEASARGVLRALLPLQPLTSAGLALLLTQHPRKGVSLPGQAARGSGAFAAFADIVIEMSRCPHARDDDRRRRLLAFSRSDTTPRQRVLELNAQASDYACLGDFLDDDFAVNWQRLRFVLEEAPRKLTRQEILADWPADFPRPADTTLYKWLERAVSVGQLLRQGTGRRHDAFRYWLADVEKIWKQDPMYDVLQKIDNEQQAFLEQERRHPSGPLPEHPASAGLRACLRRLEREGDPDDDEDEEKVA